MTNVHLRFWASVIFSLEIANWKYKISSCYSLSLNAKLKKKSSKIDIVPMTFDLKRKDIWGKIKNHDGFCGQSNCDCCQSLRILCLFLCLFRTHPKKQLPSQYLNWFNRDMGSSEVKISFLFSGRTVLKLKRKLSGRIHIPPLSISMFRASL